MWEKNLYLNGFKKMEYCQPYSGSRVFILITKVKLSKIFWLSCSCPRVRIGSLQVLVSFTNYYFFQIYIFRISQMLMKFRVMLVDQILRKVMLAKLRGSHLVTKMMLLMINFSSRPRQNITHLKGDHYLLLTRCTNI